MRRRGGRLVETSICLFHRQCHRRINPTQPAIDYIMGRVIARPIFLATSYAAVYAAPQRATLAQSQAPRPPGISRPSSKPPIGIEGREDINQSISRFTSCGVFEGWLLVEGTDFLGVVL